jgi:hypothetical protein
VVFANGNLSRKFIILPNPKSLIPFFARASRLGGIGRSKANEFLVQGAHRKKHFPSFGDCWFPITPIVPAFCFT